MIPPASAFGLLMVLTGVGFKIAMVPFHSWAPDVYEGAPNSITAFLSVGSKAGGLIILMRIRARHLRSSPPPPPSGCRC